MITWIFPQINPFWARKLALQYKYDPTTPRVRKSTMLLGCNNFQGLTRQEKIQHQGGVTNLKGWWKGVLPRWLCHPKKVDRRIVPGCFWPVRLDPLLALRLAEP